jgi:hypothetical protein
MKRNSTHASVRLATEEGRASVEALVDKVLLRKGHGRERSELVRVLTGALSRGQEGGSIRPVVVGIGRGVNGEDNVDLASLDEKRGDGDVLSVLSSVGNLEDVVAGRLEGGAGGLGSEVTEGVGVALGRIGEVSAKSSSKGKGKRPTFRRG